MYPAQAPNFPHEPGSNAGNPGCVPASALSSVLLGCGEGQAAAVVLAGVLRTLQEGAGYLLVKSPLPPPPATGAHFQSTAKRLSLHGLDPHALTVLLPRMPQRAAHTPHLPKSASPARCALASPCSPSISCLAPNASPFSYCPPHSSPGSPGALLHPGLLQESLPSPFSILAPTNGLALPGVHRPGSRASRAQIGHLAAASAVSLYRNRIGRRRAWCLQELGGEDPQAKRMAAVSLALGSRDLRLPVGGGGGGGPSATSGSYQPLPLFSLLPP